MIGNVGFGDPRAFAFMTGIGSMAAKES